MRSYSGVVPDSGPVPIGTVASAVHRLIGITKRRMRQVESILLVRDQREKRTQELAFHARPFVLCGLPLRRPPATQLVHRRRNGKFSLHIVAHPDFGLLFGQDRLIPIWVATLALRQKTREVHFNSAAQMLDFFRLPKDGFDYRRSVQAFKRVFGATIFFGSEEHSAAKMLIDWTRFHFFDHIQLWYSANNRASTGEPESDENVITLSEAFYSEIGRHRIPVEREVVSSLAHAPGFLDFYLWLAWKSWAVNGVPSRIPIVGPAGLCHQLRATEYSSPRHFRHLIVEWLTGVKAYWPDCPASITSDRRFLIVYSSRKSPAIRVVGTHRSF